MQFELIQAGEDAAALARELRALVPAPESVRAQVSEIINRVRSDGEEAVREYTRRFDTGGAEPKPLRIPDHEVEQAARGLDPGVRAGLEQAIDNVRRVASAADERDTTIDFGTHAVRLRSAPVARAAVYVPGGRAAYPSTVVMGVVTAHAAGVGEVTVCAPPGAEGEIDRTVLGACALTNSSRVYRMGGAQAIAALAYGTETVLPQDVIVGPGNLYVQEAKLQVSHQVGIDGFAGPSDLVLIADSQADPEPLALDLLAQAEHGPGTLVVVICTDGAFLDALADRVGKAPDTGAAVRGVEVVRLDQALALAQALAPEHLQLAGPHAEGLSSEITHAGCLFVGAKAGTAFGDYIAGSNHILPTNGAARFASGVSPATFRRSFAEVQIEDPAPLAKAAAAVARAEGFEYHARSMESRIRDNPHGE